MNKLIYLTILIILNTNTYSQNIDKLFNKAIDNHLNENYDAGIKLYSKILSIDSMLYTARVNRAICYSALGEKQKSISDFEYVLKYTPSDTTSLIYLATHYGLNEQYKKSIIYFQNALKYDAKLNYMDYFNLGSDYYFSGNNDSAKIYLEKSFSLDSINSPAVNNLAWVFLEEDPEKSCYYFNESYLKDTLDSRNINNLGYSHLLCGNLEEAYNLFKKAESLDPKNSFIFRNLGLYYLKSDNRKLACENLKKAIELNIIEEWGEQYVEELLRFCNNK